MAQKLDLSGLDKKQLETLKEEVEQKLIEVEKRRKQEALEAVRKTAQDYGYKLEELVGNASSKQKGKPAPKFRDPDNHSNTWSGFGRQPKWFREKLEAGVDREDLRIK